MLQESTATEYDHKVSSHAILSRTTLELHYSRLSYTVYSAIKYSPVWCATVFYGIAVLVLLGITDLGYDVLYNDILQYYRVNEQLL